MSEITSFRTSDGLVVYRQGKGPALLMIHGIISDSSFFSKTAEVLSRYYEVITYDRRGYGQSTVCEYSDYTVAAQAEDACHVIRECGLDSAIILGNSAGAIVALELVKRYPELVKLLVMMEPSLAYDEESRIRLGEWNQELNEIVKAGRLKKALPAFSRVIGDTDEQGPSQTMAEMKQTYSNLTNFLLGELNEVQRYHLTEDEVHALGCPLAIMVTEKGRKSIFATSSESAAIHLGIPLYHIPGYHNVAKTQPEDFAVSLHGIVQFML